MNPSKKLKLIISSLREPQLLSFFTIYCSARCPTLSPILKKISFNCYQATLQLRGRTINGYGKNQQQALGSGINNLFELLLEDESEHWAIRQALKGIASAGASEYSDKPYYEHSQEYSGSKKYAQKSVKTLPDCSSSLHSSVKPKPRPGKTIKEEIFESLNLDSIQIPSSSNNTLHKNSSYGMLGRSISSSAPAPAEQLQAVLARIKELENKLHSVEKENEGLRMRLKEYEPESKPANEEKMAIITQSTKKIERSSYDFKLNEREQCLKDISVKFSNADEKESKNRAYSLCSSNHASFNPHKIQAQSKAESPFPTRPELNSVNQLKIKIPKLNLEVLPNYHGRSNKSLNQSLLDNYEKKVRADC